MSDGGRAMRAKFDPGRILATPGALEAIALAGHNQVDILERHLTGDWGDLSPADRRANEAALEAGDRLLSAYALRSGVKVWVVTEAADDAGVRRATTILLSDEY